jgi:hypothetical protein
MDFDQFISEKFDECGGMKDEKFAEADPLQATMAFVLVRFLQRAERFPVSIGISPFASQADLFDFIKTNWEHIKDLQEGYVEESSLKNAKTKVNRKVQKRDDLIYQNRRLNAKQINKLLREQGFESLDYAYVRKIISLEKKKREKKFDTE